MDGRRAAPRSRAAGDAVRGGELRGGCLVWEALHCMGGQDGMGERHEWPGRELKKGVPYMKRRCHASVARVGVQGRVSTWWGGGAAPCMGGQGGRSIARMHAVMRSGRRSW
eukprot:355158-Chlamydomonas_euryale.AAC.1